MEKSKLLPFVSGILLLAATHLAHAGDRIGCPDATKEAMDAEFGTTLDGTPTSAITKCLAVRTGIKVAVNVSSDLVNGKNHILQQINNAKNMVKNYEDMYGITNGRRGYRMAVVMHGKAAKFGTVDNTTPETAATIEFLIKHGVHVYMCQNSMRANGFVTSDLLPGIEEVPAGVTAVTDFGMRGWVVLTP